MILKQRNQIKIDIGSVMFNAVGGGVILLVVGYTLVSSFTTEREAVCTERYPNPYVMALQAADGSLLTPTQLKGSLGRAQRGIVNNTEIIEVRPESWSEPGLQVNIAEGTTAGYERGDVPGGIGLVWAPSSMSAASAACLSYSVYLPDDFDFDQGGMLPGLFGGEPLRGDQRADGERAFAMRLLWQSEGSSAGYAQYEGTRRAGVGYNARRAKLPTGRWFNVAQEVLLNTPGQADGGFKVWIDDTLRLEKKGIAWRASDRVGLEGMIAEVNYGTPRHNAKAPADTFIRLSRLVMRWRNQTTDLADAQRR